MPVNYGTACADTIGYAASRAAAGVHARALSQRLRRLAGLRAALSSVESRNHSGDRTLVLSSEYLEVAIEQKR